MTEDADLGLRLARLGFRTGVVQSLTYEEANTQLVNWLGQRARWLKGFMQTWLVHMRNPVKTGRELGPTGFWTLQALTAGIFISALFHPFFVALIVWLLVVESPHASVATMLLTGLNLEVFVLGYGVAMLAGAKALAPARLEGLVVHHCNNAILLASHVRRRLDGPVAVDFRALQVEQDRARIVEASGLSGRCRPRRPKVCASGAAAG